MMDPAIILRDGGYFMYVILLTGVVHFAVLALQVARRRTMNLVPLLWALVICTVLLGFLGSVMGLIMAFQAVAKAAPEVKQTLLAAGMSIAMYTTSGALLVAIPQTFFTGAVASLLKTSRLNSRPEDTSTAS